MERSLKASIMSVEDSAMANVNGQTTLVLPRKKLTVTNNPRINPSYYLITSEFSRFKA